MVIRLAVRLAIWLRRPAISGAAKEGGGDVEIEAMKK